MKHALLLCAPLTAALSACVTAPPPPPLIGPATEQTHNLVVANADAARILAGLGARALTLTAREVSKVEMLAGAPGYAWSVGPDWLHIHVYHDRASAAAGAQRFAAAASSRTQMISWVGEPRLFQCGTALALYLGNTPQALNVLTTLCGQPVWRR